MRWLNYLPLLICLFASLSTSVAATHYPTTPIAVIAGEVPTLGKINRGKLKLIYLRKQRYWPKGVAIKPVNLNSTHPLRDYFSNSVLGSSPGAQTNYWNGQYFNGILPPYAVNSEEAVIRYVSATKGAIGYIDACQVDARVNVIGWIVNKRFHTKTPQLPHCQ